MYVAKEASYRTPEYKEKTYEAPKETYVAKEASYQQPAYKKESYDDYSAVSTHKILKYRLW